MTASASPISQNGVIAGWPASSICPVASSVAGDIVGVLSRPIETRSEVS